MSLELSFHGAAGCVTGICARLTTGRANVLIDTGMFQGPKTLKARLEALPDDAARDALLADVARTIATGAIDERQGQAVAQTPV